MSRIRASWLLAILAQILCACRLAADTGVEATRDELADALAASHHGSSNPAIQLPPYLVSTVTIKQWRYAVLPGFEILSCCRKADTEQFVREVYWQQASLDEIVPPNLQARDTVPVSLILFSEDIKRAMSASIAALARDEAEQLSGKFADAGVVAVKLPESELIPQLKLWDEDSTGVDIILRHRESGGYRNIGFAPDYIFFLLARRVPPLPSWFIEGVLDFYQTQQVMRAAASNPQRITTRVSTQEGDFEAETGLPPDSAFQRTPPLPPLTWITPKVTEVLKAHPEFLAMLPLRELLTGPPPPAGTEEKERLWIASKFAHRISVDDARDVRLGPLLPMPELMQERPPQSGSEEAKQAWLSKFWIAAQAQLILRQGAANDSPWRRDAWRSQIMLFLRWVFDDGGRSRRKSLWKFVARASAEPVTEAMFKDCFGMGFEEAGERMLGYLPTALQRGFVLTPETPLDVPPVELRDPTQGEQARILGDWQRKEIEFVKASHSEYAGEYMDQADHTLMDAYDYGSRDPGLLAALGIYECVEGDSVAARKFLEEAVQAGVVRPRAYVELARIRYKDALAKPAGGGGKLDSTQAASVLGLLRSIRSQLPPQLSGYLLTAEVCEHAAEVPAKGDLDALDEGEAYFPDNVELIRATARLRAKAGL